MSDEFEVTSKQHRGIAVDLFNGTWDLLDRTDRSADDDLKMVHMAHASRYHWSLVGDETNLSIGEWQISRVYATIGRGEPALYHGRNALGYTPDADRTPFLTAYAYEAIARAWSVLGDAAAAAEARAAGEAAAAKVAEADDRDAVLADLKTTT